MWKKAAFHIVINIICLTLIIIEPSSLLRLYVSQTKQGFICGDPSLSLPYKGNTYPYVILTTIIYIAPCFVAVIELIIHGRKNLKNLMVTAITCLMWTQQYFLLYIFQYMTLHYIKSISGFLRPYFLTECMPDLGINCTKGEFIGSDFVCTNPVTDYMTYLFARSFPSGNTMISTYPMVFIVWYLHRRLSKIPLLVPILAIIATWWILFCSITRITDHQHHTMDVIGGFIIIFPFVVYLNLKACKNFRTSSKLDVNEFMCLRIIKCFSCREKGKNKDRG